MTYKEESYVLDNVKQIAKETHENNIMFRRIIKVIGYIVQRMHRVFTNMISTEVK